MVEDDELLHRSVRPDDVVNRDGKLYLSSTAFNDAGMRPSVDRARMRTAGESKKSARDGVCGLATVHVRSITTIVHQDSQQPYKVDVVERPIDENPAHAQVEVDPAFENPSRFKKLKESLCRIAEQQWLIHPSDELA